MGYVLVSVASATSSNGGASSLLSMVLVGALALERTSERLLDEIKFRHK